MPDVKYVKYVIYDIYDIYDMFVTLTYTLCIYVNIFVKRSEDLMNTANQLLHPTKLCLWLKT